MRINWQNTVIGVGAGAIDEVMEWQDEQNARTGAFQTWTDWSRLGLAAIGYLGMMMNQLTQIAEPLALAETPLLTKSVGKWIRSQTGTPAAGRVSRVPTRSHAPAPVSRSYQKEFESAGAYVI